MVLFVLGLVGVLVIAGGAVGWYARHTYFVGLDRDRVVIYKGRPGGLLWFDPTIEQPTSLRTADVRPSRLNDLRAGHTESSRADAQRYVNNLRQEAAQAAVPTNPIPPSTGLPPAPPASSQTSP